MLSALESLVLYLPFIFSGKKSFHVELCTTLANFP